VHKIIFGYSRRQNLTQVPLETGLSSFDNIVYNSVRTFIRSWQNCYYDSTEYFSVLNIAY